MARLVVITSMSVVTRPDLLLHHKVHHVRRLVILSPVTSMTALRAVVVAKYRDFSETKRPTCVRTSVYTNTLTLIHLDG